MRALKITGLVVAALAVLLVVAILAVLLLVNPNAYRGDIERLRCPENGPHPADRRPHRPEVLPLARVGCRRM